MSGVALFHSSCTVHIDAGEKTLRGDALRSALLTHGLNVVNTIPLLGGTYFVELATVEQQERALSLSRTISIEGVLLSITLFIGDIASVPRLLSTATTSASSSSVSTPSVSMSLRNAEAVVIEYVERLVTLKAMWAGDVGSNLGSAQPYGLGSEYSSTWRALRARLEAGEHVGRLAFEQRDGKPHVLLSSQLTRPSVPPTVSSSNDDDLLSLISFIERYLADKSERRASVNGVGGWVGKSAEVGSDRSTKWRLLLDRLKKTRRVNGLVYEDHGNANDSFICLQPTTTTTTSATLTNIQSPDNRKQVLDPARTVLFRVATVVKYEDILAAFEQRSLTVSGCRYLGEYWFVEMATKVDRDIALALDNRLVFNGVAARIVAYKASNDKNR
jgi:hypothetical protein